MNIIVEAQNLHPQKDNVKLEISIPYTCPRCGVAYNESPQNTYLFEHDDPSRAIGTFAYSFYFCPHCGKGFLVEYDVTGSYYEPNYLKTFNSRMYPAPTFNKIFSKELKTLSPNFIKIYHQAEKAESNGLSEICGLRYRKALEFLVKDYAITFYPSDEEKIKNMPLSQCINAYIDNRRIKALATASAWIGNDETHYTRKHEDYNLSHLKAFIAAVVSCIDSELSYVQAEKLLNSPK